VSTHLDGRGENPRAEGYRTGFSRGAECVSKIYPRPTRRVNHEGRKKLFEQPTQRLRWRFACGAPRLGAFALSAAAENTQAWSVCRAATGANAVMASLQTRVSLHSMKPNATEDPDWRQTATSPFGRGRSGIALGVQRRKNSSMAG